MNYPPLKKRKREQKTKAEKYEIIKFYECIIHKRLKKRREKGLILASLSTLYIMLEKI